MDCDQIAEFFSTLVFIVILHTIASFLSSEMEAESVLQIAVLATEPKSGVCVQSPSQEQIEQCQGALNPAESAGECVAT